jgi:hypothetical protein
MLVAATLIGLAGCGPRVLIVTGTTLGLKATPGDGETRPPQVTLGYKRAETAIVPTKGEFGTANSDAYSVLAAFDFRSAWFGKTELASFIASGNAARKIQTPQVPGQPSAFATAFAKGTIVPDAEALQTRKVRLIERWKVLSDAEATAVLTQARQSTPPGWTATQWLQDLIVKGDETAVAGLEQAFTAAGY